MQQLRLGIIGAGWVVANRHLPGLREVPGIEVAAIWSRDPDKARRLAAEFGIGGTAAQWQEITGDPKLDAVIIATPPVLHLAATRAALAGGKHVLCQARMARNLQEAQAMVQAAQASDRVTALYPPRPGLKGDRVMRRLLREEGFVGEIREVRVTGMGLANATEGYDWRTDPEVVGVNAMTLGLWAEVLNRWVGPATRVVASGTCHRELRNTRNGTTVAAVVPDSLAVAAELACGATATYHLSEHAAFGPGHSIEIYGSRGALVYRLFADEILGTTAGSTQLQPIAIPEEEARFQDTDAAFVRAIREGRRVSPDFEEGVRYMAFCEAVAYSVATGDAVSVPPAQPLMDAWGQLLD